MSHIDWVSLCSEFMKTSMDKITIGTQVDTKMSIQDMILAPLTIPSVSSNPLYSSLYRIDRSMRPRIDDSERKRWTAKGLLVKNCV